MPSMFCCHLFPLTWVSRYSNIFPSGASLAGLVFSTAYLWPPSGMWSANVVCVLSDWKVATVWRHHDTNSDHNLHNRKDNLGLLRLDSFKRPHENCLKQFRLAVPDINLAGWGSSDMKFRILGTREFGPTWSDLWFILSILYADCCVPSHMTLPRVTTTLAPLFPTTASATLPRRILRSSGTETPARQSLKSQVAQAAFGFRLSVSKFRYELFAKFQWTGSKWKTSFV